MEILSVQGKRVIVVFWKNNTENPFEVFSNLKNFCLSYPQFNYNTISNYLSKAKVAYENQEIRIERKNIILKPKPAPEPRIRKIAPVLRRVMLKDANDEQHDLIYWLGRPVKERAAAVTHIISQSLTKGQRMDKTKLVKKRIYA
ncbi:hypothetical protein [Pedobacter antarcticus]|uniref:Uncharacterized protein n=2 Tax=Pedobacter antarcticus TaxID=34086 RepID=A0A081PBK7_9SPHI|nr:hypothetical protein [Pedobacter antarcticus]KEQ28080.1 hypothetical protein N180_00120 [Pedobacter antarcticus 4BY]SDL43616.1 hypothetical protein SAMN04488084_101282 [Pedobacter antarcticus]SFE41197.1 hypothetical protein SAMN03003324_00389 [Pedobacter antarcticus]